VDFSRSLTDQRGMCELVACYVLQSYLLDAFHVVGYLWPNGERGVGKTTLLQVLAELGYLGLLILSGSSYATLRDLADYGDRAAAGSGLVGRDLEPWRGLLAVALWLEQRHGVAGLHGRIAAVSVAYQQERTEYEAADAVRILFASLLSMFGEQQEELTFLPKELASRMNQLAQEEELVEKDKDYTSSNKVGWALRKQRFRRAVRNARGKSWTVSRVEVEALARCYGVQPEPDVGEAPPPPTAGAESEARF
jgi:hypothetical protein